ncbi:type II toxin-antitoxin system Phd/YefM family antitoxin [Oribacterium sinus]|uniref:type II toxin-antitoxin system Phd/YefM family antitoxin n=1 Tax=Oribacterium sinus TaxID=237576 RepID=UPI0028E19722|nr:type II toxin-antitoxin system prevent-host-death family antitoxin [Oribacterium sinus]
MIENIAIATVTEMQNFFERYLAMVQEGNEIIVTKNGKEVGRFIPREKAVSYLTDSLAGILKGDTDLDKAREKRLGKKYEFIS